MILYDGDNMTHETNWDKFCNKFKKLDMDSKFEVQKLAIAWKKWVAWNKGKCTIEIWQSFEFDTIIVLHDFFGDSKFEDSYEFLDDIIYLLDLYSGESDEDWEYMIDFWCNQIDLLR